MPLPVFVTYCDNKATATVVRVNLAIISILPDTLTMLVL